MHSTVHHFFYRPARVLLQGVDVVQPYAVVMSAKVGNVRKVCKILLRPSPRLGDSIADCAAPSRVGWERYDEQSPFCSVDAPFLLEFTPPTSVVAKAQKNKRPAFPWKSGTLYAFDSLIISLRAVHRA